MQCLSSNCGSVLCAVATVKTPGRSEKAGKPNQEIGIESKHGSRCFYVYLQNTVIAYRVTMQVSKLHLSTSFFLRVAECNVSPTYTGKGVSRVELCLIVECNLSPAAYLIRGR